MAHHVTSSISQQKKIFSIMCVCVFIIILNKLYSNSTPATSVTLTRYRVINHVTCYDRTILDERRLESILEASIKPVHNKNIFFHNTGCKEDGIVDLNGRQACAIESAAAQNPDWQIFVIFNCDVGFRNSTPLPIVDKILSYPNVYLRYVSIQDYTKGTPLEHWIYERKLFESKYLASHFSDVMRFLSLFRYGGTHLDMDVVVMQSLNRLNTNYVGRESPVAIGSCILNFQSNGIGHKIAEMCLNELNTNFNGSDWASNGPGVITRVLKSICETDIPEMDPDHCKGFNVYGKGTFFAIPWWDHAHFFEEKYVQKTMAAIKDTVITHVWNKQSSETKIKVGSNVAYGLLADQYCPKIYRSIGKYF